MCARLPPLRLRKSLGQNFLRDENVARKIVSAIHPGSDQVLVEIGPGDGALTRHLAPQVKYLVIVDVDSRVVERLKTMQFGGNVEIIHEDFLKLDLENLAHRHGKLRVVGNIPYNITTPILFQLLDHRAVVVDAVMLMQREVARRLVARPGTKEHGILSVACQLWAQPEIHFNVSPNVFVPRPAVTSSLVHLTMRAEPAYRVTEERFFRDMIRSIFGKRRKTLRNSLRYFLGEEPKGCTEKELARRPEDLTVQELVDLGNRLHACRSTTLRVVRLEEQEGGTS
jgi:16S rRNA (adenine1518-N6/adenine1519-N6)-dimethyltransferase